ncbi:TNF receptor-associated factor 3-like [Paramuricea clavata]|uniref:TNF receptor-associated factor 3-like n=1 Tax=Paramuricea clavata TaxID=317549 RepID=A0A6S7IEZ8_PARCT|nr:TNF receptor-associated factor 3-like [Paramuricea clavata]
MENNVRFNVSKCKVLTITRKKNPIIHNYTLGSQNLTRADIKAKKILELPPHQNVLGTFTRTPSSRRPMFGVLRRTCTKLMDMKARRTLYLSLVKSQLCYATEVWSPVNSVQISRRVEKVQRRATRWITMTKRGELSYRERLLALDLLPLTYDREVRDLVYFFKSLFSYIDVNIDNYVLFGHSAVCQHALINCIHSQCKMTFQRSHQGEHLKSECEYRNVKCDFCGKDVTFASMKEHIGKICEDAPVACKYCKKDVLRKDIERHERRDCNEAPATCEYQAVGCNHDKTLKQKELRQHLNDALVNHGGQLLRYTLAVASQLSDFIPRPEYTGMLQKIQDDITEVRSGLAEKFVMVVGKLTGLERRIESLESSGGGDTRIRNKEHELQRTNKSLIPQVQLECGSLNEFSSSTTGQPASKEEIQIKALENLPDDYHA